MKRTAACSITVLAASLLSVLAQTQPPVDPKIARTVLRPSSAAKVEVRTVKYRAADDVELPADIYFNPDTKGPRPTLLFISGTEETRATGVVTATLVDSPPKAASLALCRRNVSHVVVRGSHKVEAIRWRCSNSSTV